MSNSDHAAQIIADDDPTGMSESGAIRARYVIRAIFYLMASPIVFVGCLVQATGVALIYALVAVPFGGKRVFVVSYRERGAGEKTFKIEVGS